MPWSMQSTWAPPFIDYFGRQATGSFLEGRSLMRSSPRLLRTGRKSVVRGRTTIACMKAAEAESAIEQCLLFMWSRRRWKYIHARVSPDAVRLADRSSLFAERGARPVSPMSSPAAYCAFYWALHRRCTSPRRCEDRRATDSSCGQSAS